MTSPALPRPTGTSPAGRLAPARRLVLVPAGPPKGRGDAAVRRFRLAMLRLDGSDLPSAERKR